MSNSRAKGLNLKLYPICLTNWSLTVTYVPQDSTAKNLHSAQSDFYNVYMDVWRNSDFYPHTDELIDFNNQDWSV